MDQMKALLSPLRQKIRERRTVLPQVQLDVILREFGQALS
jgi:hypothetical protein